VQNLFQRLRDGGPVGVKIILGQRRYGGAALLLSELVGDRAGSVVRDIGRLLRYPWFSVGMSAQLLHDESIIGHPFFVDATHTVELEHL